MNPKTFTRIRKRLDLTQRELARKLGVHPITVAKWETDVHAIPAPVARLIAMLAEQAPAPKERGRSKRASRPAKKRQP